MTSPAQNNHSSIQVISRAAGILRLLGRKSDGLSLGQIAREVELPRSTVQRIVSALSEEGLVANKNGNGSIQLGPEIQQLARASGGSIADRMLPIMKRLSAHTGETVDLAILENGKMRFIDQVEGSHRLRTVSRIGELFPLTSTANGKAALACIDLSMAQQLIKKELGITGSNSKALKELLVELEAIRTGGIATDENEHTEGISALGIAVSDGHDVFALSIPVPSARFKREKVNLANAVREHVGEHLTNITPSYTLE